MLFSYRAHVTIYIWVFMLGCDQALEKDLVLGCDVTLNCQLEMEEQENYHWETHTYAIR